MDQLRAPRQFIEGLGLDWVGSRFGEYERTLAKVTEPKGTEDPAFFAEDDGADSRRGIIMEGGGQLFQMLLASEIFGDLDRAMLKASLQYVLDGPEISEMADDKPRSTLLELVTAKIAKDIGFKVTLTKQDEDVRLDYPGLARGAIECKRPLHQKAVLENLNKIGEQLRKREKNGSTYGFATIGADRMFGLAAGKVLGCDSIEELDWVTEQKTSQLMLKILQMAKEDPACSLVPPALIGVVVVSGAVHLTHQRMIYPFCQWRHFPLVDPSKLPSELDKTLMAPMSPDTKYAAG
jgi:hypothetical protein